MLGSVHLIMAAMALFVMKLRAMLSQALLFRSVTILSSLPRSEKREKSSKADPDNRVAIMPPRKQPMFP